MQYRCDALSERAAGYGMPGELVDGTDLVEVLNVTGKAIERARWGGGPTLLECRTMRMRGHSEHDDFRYVPPSLLEAWNAWDPVERFCRYLEESHGWEGAQDAALRQALAEEIEEAEQAAGADPDPEASRAKEDAYRRWDSAWTIPLGGQTWP